MKIIKVKDYDEMSTTACELMVDRIKTIKNPVLGLATGSTPIGLYEQLIETYKQDHVSFKNVTTFNLDEYIGLAKDNPNSYHFFMSEKLFNHIDISPEKTYVPNGVASDLKQEAVDYERLIQKENGIDLQVLGLGTNGHIAFNEPGTKFSSRTDIVDLAQATLDANARFFDSIDEVPTQAVTMGIESIMEGREIVLLVSGEGKAEALKSTINGEVTEDFPASILQTHQNVTIIADEAALSLI
ncbi:MAG TPA: glucosamine-6-phosphate deaminase [Virgibacillus sp.]|nr:glucosamine-6-phosphate deaminase [Virgibacillus sp.]